MKHLKRIGLCGFCLIFASACGTISQRIINDNQSTVMVYKGTQMGAAMACSLVDHCRGPSCGMLSNVWIFKAPLLIGTVVGLPMDMVTDTLLLPYDAINRYTKKTVAVRVQTLHSTT